MLKKVGKLKVFSIEKILQSRKEDSNQRKVDLEASYVLLEQCLFYLDMNEVQELKRVKKELRQTMKELKGLIK